MKHLKLYEKKYNKNSLENFYKEKNELYDLIKEYSILNNLFEFASDDIICDFYYEHNYEKVGDEVIIVLILDNVDPDSPVRSYSINNIYELNFYIENPNRNKTSTKFNL